MLVLEAGRANLNEDSLSAFPILSLCFSLTFLDTRSHARDIWEELF